jgi:hypothetical protein
MKHCRVRIFTEEYFVDVYTGKFTELARIEARVTKKKLKSVLKDSKYRGRMLNSINEGYFPIILLRQLLAPRTKRATLAHEASHAMSAIEKYIGMNDKSGEFHSHGIAAIMRVASEKFNI